MSLGMALAQQGKIEEAQGHFVKALELEPDNERIQEVMAATLGGE